MKEKFICAYCEKERPAELLSAQGSVGGIVDGESHIVFFNVCSECAFGKNGSGHPSSKIWKHFIKEYRDGTIDKGDTLWNP